MRQHGPYAERITRLERTAAAVRAAFDAEHDVVAPPLVIGGGGQQMLQAAARLADIITVNIPLLSGRDVASNRITGIGEEDAVASRIALIRSVSATVEIQMNLHEVYVGADWSDFAAPRRELGMEPAALLDSPHVLVGDVTESSMCCTNGSNDTASAI